MPKIIRSKSLAYKIANKIRLQLESNKTSLGDLLCSERELSMQYKVSRKTIRASLSILVQEGFVVSVNRQGYQVKKTSDAIENNQLIAYVLGTDSRHWELGSYFHETWNYIQKYALSKGKNVFALAKEDMSAAQICERLIKHQVKGVIVNADDSDIPLELNKAGIPLVLIDTASSELESVNQNNFDGAYQMTNHLIKLGCKNIVWMGRHLELIQGQERLGGYLTALHNGGLKLNQSNIISSLPEKTKLESLHKLCMGNNAIDGIVIMWPQLIEEVVNSLSKIEKKPEVVAWWGGYSEVKKLYKSNLKQYKSLPGVHWNTNELAEMAILKLEERILYPAKSPTRTMVPLYFTEK